MFRLLVPVIKPRVFLLQMSGIRKDDAAQINRRRRGIHRAAEAFADQPRNPAAVVEVRMGQDHRIDAGCWHRRGLPVAQPPFLGSLEHAAIDQHLKSGFAVPV